MTDYEIKIRNVIESACKEHAIIYKESDFEIEDSVLYKHNTPKFRIGMKSVFMFIEKGNPDIILGVYICGAKSKPRFCYAHYKPTTPTPSTLAKTLYNEPSSGHYNDINVGKWLKDYTRRINIFFDDNYETSKPAFINTLKYRLQEAFNAKYNLSEPGI